MAYGPIQMVVLGFDSAELPVDVVDELRVLRAAGAVRLVDAVWVSKDDNGDLLAIGTSDFDAFELEDLAGLAGALFGLGAGGVEGALIGAASGWEAAASDEFGISEDDILEISDRIPPGTSAAVLILEHRWASGFKEAVLDNGGVLIAQGFITPDSIIALGEEFVAENLG